MSWIGKAPFQEIGMNEDKIELLKELARDGGYWSDANSFVLSISNRKLSSLSEKQRDWLYDISASLSVELDRRTAKELYSEDQG